MGKNRNQNSNPFEPPIQSGPTAKFQAIEWTGRQVLGAAVLATAIGPAVGLLIHLGFGVSLIEILVMIESQIWLMLLVSTGILVMWAGQLNNLLRQGTNIAATIRCTLALSSLVLLLLNIFHSVRFQLSGIPSNRFLFFQRAFGDYSQYYWWILVALGVFPLFLLLPRLRKLDRCAVPVSVIVFLTAAFFLRVNYIIYYAEQIPTSWHQFFWPF